MADSNTIGGNSLYSGQGRRAVDGSAASTFNTGALRRKYNFGDYVSELALSQDPFFRFLSMVSKKPTDDPTFKFTEKRSSYTKRYAYMSDFSTTAISIPATDPSTSGTPAEGNVYTFSFFTDYNNDGNMQNIHGQVVDYYEGALGTQPKFFIPGQIIKIPHGSTAANADAGTVSGYSLWKINSVDLDTHPSAATSSSDTNLNKAIVNATCVKGSGSAVFFTNAVASAGITDESAAGLQHASSVTTTGKSSEFMENFKCYVVGSAFAAGSGYPETWADQPYSTNYGQTQIFKTSAVMNNTDRATVLKYEGNEWARIWKEKLIEHKWDIENALLFGSYNSTYGTTEGAVNFISTYGNSFSLNTATKTQDDFLDDLSAMLDPRYNNAGSTVFFCSTAVYNWLHKLSGYFANNIEISPNYRADFSISGKKKVFGIDITTISTVYGDMNVARNVHLDGTNVKMIGINMKYAAYRPLVGNGINRDTSVYVGVQTLENSGVDRRVDQILTEAGMEWCCPETHALWT
jgi:hypothetical protein